MEKYFTKDVLYSIFKRCDRHTILQLRCVSHTFYNTLASYTQFWMDISPNNKSSETDALLDCYEAWCVCRRVERDKLSRQLAVKRAAYKRIGFRIELHEAKRDRYRFEADEICTKRDAMTAELLRHTLVAKRLKFNK